MWFVNTRVVLKGTKGDGKEFRKAVSTETELLNLEKSRLSSVDLSPLSECKKLQELNLSYNQLSSVDLTPLRKCKKLEVLNLHSNLLSFVDLSPLRKCKKLLWLFLSENQFSSVELTPLRKCKKIEELRLDAGVSIVWRSAQLDLERLPFGLEEYADKIKQAWEEFMKKQQ